MPSTRGKVDRERHAAVIAGSSRATQLIAVILAVGALYLARPLLIPFALAIVLGFLFSPFVAGVERWGLRRMPAALVVVALSFSAFVALGWLVGFQMRGLAGDLPSYREQLIEKARHVRRALGGSFGEARETIQEIRKEITTPPPTQPAGTESGARHEATRAAAPFGMVPGGNENAAWYRLLGWERPRAGNAADPPGAKPVPVTIEPGEDGAFRILGAILGPFVGPLISVGMAMVLVIFLLGQREKMRERVVWLAERGHLRVPTEALGEVVRQLSRYLLVQVCINALHGLAITGGLCLIGVPRAPLWGLLAALLRFVPFVGTWVAAAIPIVLSLAVFDDWVRPALVAGLFLCIDLLSANLLEPWLYGARTGIAPIALFVSAIFWTWLWGGIGLFLATPLTVCLIVVGRHVPQLDFLAVLLGDQPSRSTGPRV